MLPSKKFRNHTPGHNNGAHQTRNHNSDNNNDGSVGGVKIVGISPYNRDAFTQGLTIHQNQLYESTGLVGRSWVRSNVIIDERTPACRPEIARADLEPPLFGEGITITGDTLWQLTWKTVSP